MLSNDIVPHARRTSGPSRSSRRARWRGPNDGEPATSNRTSALVFDVLACWPPGPPDALKRHDSSDNGTDNDRVTRNTSSSAIGVVYHPGNLR